MSTEKPNILGAILGMKCPNCRKGSMYTNKSIFPLKHMMDMPDKCSVCGQKMEIEVGFYYGTGYVSYGLSIALTVANLVWFWLFFGISFRDNSIYYYIITDVAVIILAQPWLMRYSRVLYLYMFVRYGKGATFKGSNQISSQNDNDEMDDGW